MKKRFIIDNDASTLWESLEQENIIEVRGGTTNPTSSITPPDRTNGATIDDHTITLAKWVLSF